jgi:hypothetical protein
LPRVQVYKWRQAWPWFKSFPAYLSLIWYIFSLSTISIYNSLSHWEQLSIYRVEASIMHFEWLQCILLAAILAAPLEVSARASMYSIIR